MPFSPLEPGDPVTAEWLNDGIGSAVHGISVGGGIEMTRLGSSVALYSHGVDSVATATYTAVITGHTEMIVRSPDGIGNVYHPYRWKYSFREILPHHECLGERSSLQPDKACTKETATSIQYFNKRQGRSGSTSVGWAMNLTELSHSAGASDDGTWWIWGRNINASFYPKLYRPVALGSDYDGSHVYDYPVLMHEMTGGLGMSITFFTQEGHHIGEC